LKPERGRRSQNVVKRKLCDKVLKETKGPGVQIPDSTGTKEGSDTGIRQKESLRRRVRLEDCYTWQCTDCPTVLATLQELKEHHRLAHEQTVRFQCIECAKVYTVYKKFTRHVRVHRNSGKYRYGWLLV
jgi:predicted nucleic acid-binding Zn ribbon protein